MHYTNCISITLELDIQRYLYYHVRTTKNCSGYSKCQVEVKRLPLVADS
jgi:hypothetical protein